MTPTSTYRIQLRGGTTFADLDDTVLRSLARLGISHLYLSPVAVAAPGSSHGYDVVDHRTVDPELGGEAGLEDLAHRARSHGLGLVVDIVPNHMAVHARSNPWWWDVLRNGPSSEWAQVFDIDWDSPERRLAGRLLLPVLTDHYGRELERGAFEVLHHRGELVLRHPSVELPIESASSAVVFDQVARLLDHPELAFLAGALERLPHFGVTDPEEVARRRRDQSVVLARIAELCEDPDLRRAVDAEAASLTSRPDDLDVLLDAQPYRLARWQEGVRDLGYRRFFDITSLIGVRVEQPAVFQATHGALLGWVDRGLVDGIRVDHPDGIADPDGYFRLLREAAPDAWIVVEKILEGEERLRSWPVDGTTGYDAAEAVARVFLDDEGHQVLREAAQRRDAASTSAHDVVTVAKREVLRSVLAADLNRLTERMLELCEHRRRFRDFSRHELHECLVEAIVRLPVYRTYAPPVGGADEHDRQLVETATEECVTARPDLDPELFELLRSVLTDPLAPGAPWEWEVRQRFQQLSGPAMAKGKEDTAWYRWVALLSRNEVGADPDAAGSTIEQFHDEMLRRRHELPTSMTLLTTHDSKRSEDVRARLSVLAELGEEWVATSERWHSLLEPTRRDGRPEPATVEYLLQTLVGAWPIDDERLLEHLAKAAREAKVHTTWLQPDEDYERFLDDFALAARATLAPELDDLDDRIRRAARVTALGQKLVQLTMPGIPDLYQGTERWHLRLVDPDNRQPVDIAALDEALEQLSSRPVGAGLDDPADDGVDKLRVVAAALTARRELPEAFAGDYEPLLATGERADHVVAFGRGSEVVVVATRCPLQLARHGWGDTSLALPEGTWVDRVTGRVLSGDPASLAKLVEPLGVALLVRDR